MALTVLFLLLTLIYSSYTKQYICDSTAPCGCLQKPPSLSQIIGEKTVTHRYWGWIVSISIDGYPSCGGSILSSSWILTTASCVADRNNSEVTIYAGSNDVLNGTQIVKPAMIIPHRNYNRTTLLNDIALMRLATPLNMSDPTLAKICLPQNTTDNYPEENSTLVKVAWGSSVKTYVVSRTLRQVLMKIVSNNDEKCQSLNLNSSTQLCASAVELLKDTCRGDSGSPLMVYTSSRQWTIVGITSYGLGCYGDSPTIYTRVPAYMAWIKSMNVTDAIAVNVSPIPTDVQSLVDT